MTPYQAASGYYRPVSMIYLFSFHALNLFLHMVCSFFVYLISRRLGLTFAAALAGAFIFAVHPAHVEAVAPIYNYMGLLASFFALLSFWAWMKFRENSKKSFALISIFTFALALYSKEDAIVLIGLVFIYDLIFCRFEKFRAGFKDLIPLITVIIVYLLMRVLFVDPGASLGLKHVESSHNFAQASSGFGKIGQMIQVYAEYFRMLVWPRLLSPFHSLPAFSLSNLESWFQVILFFLLGLGTWLFRKEKVLLFSGAWFFATLFLVSNIISIGGLFAERLVYWPSAAYAFFLAWSFDRLRVFRKVGAVILCLTVLGSAYAFRTWAYIPVWNNDVSLWEYGSAVTADRALPRLNLGEAYFERGEYEKAISAYQALLAFPQKPLKEAMIRHKLARCFGEMKRYDQALAEIQKVLQTMPWDEQIYFDLGWTLYLQGKIKEARDVFELLTIRKPQYPWGYYGMAAIAESEGKILESKQFYAQVLNHSADNPQLTQKILKKFDVKS